MNYTSKKRQRRIQPRFFVFLAAIIAVAVLIVVAVKLLGDGSSPHHIDIVQNTATPDGTGSLNTTEPSAAPTPTPIPISDPTGAESTRPSIMGLRFDMNLDGNDIESYRSPFDTVFGDASEYASSVKGVTTFRGNNFRDDATYGTAGVVAEKKLELVWTKDIPGSIAKGGASGAWFGCGWTGQPLIAQWDKDTVNIMNIFPEKKSKEGLTEIIYATENSYIYFLDLDDGSFTRNHINGKWAFKGSGAIDPRGYPLLYVGAGDSGPNGAAPNLIFSLIDGSVLYSYGAGDSYALRGFKAYDGATLVHAESDSVTYASESGIIYRFKLNTVYDKQAGAISINPSNILKWRYTTERTRSGGSSSYWLGFESSPVMWRHYMYVADNAGNLFCIDMHTMETVWIQDVLDDTNNTPIFEINEDKGECYIYIGTSAHWTVDGNNIANIPFWKINALTGEIIWKDEGYRCTRDNVSGGVQTTSALGKNNVSDLIFVSYAMTVDTATRGTLVAYDKTTAEKKWVFNLDRYSYSSPIVLYDDSGDGYVVTFDSSGKMYLIDARNGILLDSLQLEGNFEASPAAFNNMIVIGTRASKIYGIRLK